MAVNIRFIHTCSRFLMVDFTTSASAQARVYNEDSLNLRFLIFVVSPVNRWSYLKAHTFALL